MEKRNKIIFGSLGSLLFLNILAWNAVFYLSRPQNLEITFFNVGQGEAAFIETPRSYQILIDSGPSSVILEKLAQEMPFWDRTIDLAVLTHPEHDHLAGFIEVLKRYRVENILWTGVKRDTAEAKEWQELIKKEGTRIQIAQAGQSILIPDSKETIKLAVLFPFDNIEGQEIKDTNSTSIILRLVFDETSFLFTGDAYKSAEKELLTKNTNIDSDVLKVGHHGSKTSTSEQFVVGVSPKIAVISAGKNNQYGHPHKETLATLEKYGIYIFRTDEKGDIKILSNGKEINFKPN